MPTRINDPLTTPDLKLWHRCLCVVLAYLFLVGPEAFHILARADTQYSDLTTASWGSGNRTIEYEYDANGSMTQKTTRQTLPLETLEVVDYVYNLQNRLVQVTTTPYTDGAPGIPEVVDYAYNPSGIRVQKIVDDINQTDYLVDPANPTGYAQVLEESACDMSDPQNPVLNEAITYTIGDDIITQSSMASGIKHLLYDGHGSTRQLVNPDKSVHENYAYDSYGVMLGDSTTPKPAQTTGTNLLYSGEQYDKHMDEYYLRARYYNQNSGVFNSIDPYFGSLQDPQSLHKYLYVRNDPINNIDPSGLMTSTELLTVSTIISAFLFIAMNPNVSNAPGPYDITISDQSGDLIEDAFYMIGGTIIVYTVILPVARTTIRFIKGNIRRLKLLSPSGSSPGKFITVNENMSNRAAAYQTKITGNAADTSYIVNNVKFDGYNSGILLEAKGPGYAKFVKNGRFMDFYRGKEKLIEQAYRQLQAANGVSIEWYIAEQDALQAIQNLFDDFGIEGIKLILKPAG